MYVIFCICSLIQIINGKAEHKIVSSEEVFLHKESRSHTVSPTNSSQATKDCYSFNSFPNTPFMFGINTPKNLHTYLARTPKTTPPKRLLTYFPSKRTHPASLLRKSRIKAPEQATPHTSKECIKTLVTPEKSCDNGMQHNADDGLHNLTLEYF